MSQYLCRIGHVSIKYLVLSIKEFLLDTLYLLPDTFVCLSIASPPSKPK